MRCARIGLLTLAAAAAPLLARGTPESAASTTTVKTAPVCSVPAPLPLLNKRNYADHAFAYGLKNTAVESASTGTVHIEVQFSGYRGGFEHTFVFIDDKPLGSYDDRDRWLRFASSQLQALQTYHRGRADVKDLLDFLSGARIATTRKSPSELRIEVCRDGSPFAKDACPAKSGGWHFAVRPLDRGRMQVTVSRYLPAE